jgi:methionyl-tRNA formyltransferase
LSADYKGNATVNWTIINGEDHIYGNIHKMDPELDAGDVVTRKSIGIGGDTYIDEILKQAEKDVPYLYEEAINKVLATPDAFEVKGTVHGLRCYPRLPEDSQINWNAGCLDIYRLIRASAHPYKGAFSFLNGEKIVIWKAKPVIPQDKFLAMPGHVVAIDKVRQTVSVACPDGLLEIQETGRNEEVLPPTAFINSIRVRFK